MPDPTDTPSSTEPPSPSGGDLKASRRRLLQGALASAPVLMTLVSRPVLAQQCTTPSGYVSLNASTAGRGVTCTGRQPSYWSTSQSYGDWTPPYYPTTVGGQGGHQATRFDDVFKPHYSGKTLLQVVSLQGLGNDPANSVAQLIVAALLNAAKGNWTPVLTVQVVKGMWSEYITTGAFSPSSGASWTQGELIDYLLRTMP